jgi:formate-dependent nitrite reductase membrane component NrfD
VIDLERPERFYYILTRPNWRSWMVWGAYFLTGHGLLAALWLGAWLVDSDTARAALVAPALIVSILATSYTGFLFAQGLGRDLWQGPLAGVDLIAQSVAEGAAALLIAGALASAPSPELVRVLAWTLFGSVAAHLMLILFENVLAVSPTMHHELAVQTIRRGAYARLFWGLAIGIGGLMPLLLIPMAPLTPAVTVIASVLALAGGFAWEYVWVEAGQSVPLS